MKVWNQEINSCSECIMYDSSEYTTKCAYTNLHLREYFNSTISPDCPFSKPITKEVIEGFGFICLEEPIASDTKWSNEYTFVHNKLTNRYLMYNVILHRLVINNNRNMEYHFNWFSGKCYNSEELRFILTSLGIIE